MGANAYVGPEGGNGATRAAKRLAYLVASLQLSQSVQQWFTKSPKPLRPRASCCTNAAKHHLSFRPGTRVVSRTT